MQPQPSEAVRAKVAKGDKIGAIKLYRDENGGDLKAAKAVIERVAAGDYGPLPTPKIVGPDRPTTLVRRKRGTTAGVMKWYRKEVEALAAEGYTEVSHHQEGVARGCAALFAPKLAYMVVTYRRIEDKPPTEPGG